MTEIRTGIGSLKLLPGLLLVTAAVSLTGCDPYSEIAASTQFTEVVDVACVESAIQSSIGAKTKLLSLLLEREDSPDQWYYAETSFPSHDGVWHQIKFTRDRSGQTKFEHNAGDVAYEIERPEWEQISSVDRAIQSQCNIPVGDLEIREVEY